MLSHSEDTWFQAIVRRNARSWNWCFLTCTRRMGSLTLEVLNVCHSSPAVWHTASCRRCPSFQGSGESRKMLTRALATKVAELRTFGCCRTSPFCPVLLWPAPPGSLCWALPHAGSLFSPSPASTLRLLYCLVFPLVSCLLSDPHQRNVRVFWYHCDATSTFCFNNFTLSICPFLRSPDCINEKYLCIS